MGRPRSAWSARTANVLTDVFYTAHRHISRRAQMDALITVDSITDCTETTMPSSRHQQSSSRCPERSGITKHALSRRAVSQLR